MTMTMDGAQPRREEIAIIGMVCRVPGAKNIDEFWQNLSDGVESIRTLTDEELKASGCDAGTLDDPSHVRAAAFMDDADCFDASFFGIGAREAELMDPQHRVFLESAWAALENAGYDPAAYTGRIGVFGGVAPNTYFQKNVSTRPDLVELLGSYPTMIASEKEYSVTRVSFKLDLKGPSVFVSTACSTSGVALHFGCQSVLTGECDMALVGGARVRVPMTAGYIYEEDGILSPDGRCRAFDATARGTVAGTGVAAIVIKRLSEAIRDGDTIYSIIKGTAINNDGAQKVGFTAPSVQGQSAVVAEALAMAEVAPETISYVEAHGTGTPVGDPIEVAALTQAFQTSKRRYCAIGSVKTNIGHLDAGAGVIGVIKTALSLRNKKIPPSLHFERPNPQIDFENSPFYVNEALADWPSDGGPRRAGVSSFGLGGTNAHIILEEAPETQTAPARRTEKLLVLSAKTKDALDNSTANLAEYLRKDSDTDLADVAYTLQVGRQRFEYRRALTCRDSGDAVAALSALDPRRVSTSRSPHVDRSPIFMFPGGGAQYANMGLGLYRGERRFREAVDRCTEILHRRNGLDLKALLYPHLDDNGKNGHDLERPSLALPTLFTMEYALAHLWMSWGLEPTAMIGHSMGEYTAAHLAGVLSLEDALALVSVRGELFEKLPEGSMLSVPMSEMETQAYMEDGLSLAAVNTPHSCIVSGPSLAVRRMEKALEAQDIESKRIHVSVAAHSSLVEPILQEFSDFLDTIRFHKPSVPFISGVTGTWADAEEVTTSHYWVKHLRQTVRFSDGMQVLLRETDGILLEVGPGQTLTMLARQHPAKAPERAIVSSLRHPKDPTSDSVFLLNGLGRLWLAGAAIDWDKFYDDEKRQRVPLPCYPFERKRYWIDPADKATVSASLGLSAPKGGGKVALESGPEASETTTTPVTSIRRKERVLAELSNVIVDLSGMEPESIDTGATFLELGFDSLFLTQASTAFKRKFKVKITFRQLLQEAPTLDALAAYIDEKLAPDAFPDDAPPAASAVPAGLDSGAGRGLQPEASTGEHVLADQTANSAVPASVIERIVNEQLKIMNQQLELLRAGSGAGETLPQSRTGKTPSTAAPTPAVSSPAAATEAAPVGPWRPIDRSAGAELSPQQRAHLGALIDRFTQRTKRSKDLTQTHRAKLADPRTAAGFHLPWKELVYPIVAARSSGSRIWDVDGNEWLDITNGFGITLFGHSPPFIVEAVERQLKETMAIGPQVELAGAVAAMICEFTGMERVTFCNTGSEAVLAAIRVARTVTGRDKIAVFSGDYHGIFDEVLVKGVARGESRRSLPVAPGIPREAVENVLVLDYGDFASLETVKEHADDLAAIIVEPVQSRRPDLQPREFVQALRGLTEELNIPLVFDEIITGFRAHPGGAQAWYGVKADIATYGKVIAGGMPIGALAGKARFMDALDGGMWSFGDDSAPETGVTWFAGTFVRHPLALAAAYASLCYLKQSGPGLQEQLNRQTQRFADELNAHFGTSQLPIRINHFSSMFQIKVEGNPEFAGLFWHYLRDQGIHCHEGRPNFFTTAFTEEDYATLSRAFKDAAAGMRAGGFFPASSDSAGAAVVGAGATPYEAPVTEEQLEIWLASQIGDDASCGFNISFSIDLKGVLRLDAMRTAIRQLIQRHDALRMTVSATGDRLHFSPTLDLDIEYDDFSADGSAGAAAGVDATLSRHLGTPFDLENGPLVRASIAKLAQNSHVVIVTAHHVCLDGFSCGILVREMAALYAAACTGRPAQLEPARQYSEYAEWQSRNHGSEEFAETEAYWLEQYAGDPPPPLDLPCDRPRPALKTFPSQAHVRKLDGALCAKLKKRGAQRGCTLFSTLLGGFAVWLHNITRQHDVAIGILAAGQVISGDNPLVGHCAHYLPLRSRLDRTNRASEFLEFIQDQVIEAFEYRNYTEGSLLKKLQLPRDKSRLPLVNVQFNLDSAPLSAGFHDLEADLRFNDHHYNLTDLSFHLVEKDGEVVIDCVFNTDLFDRQTIDRWLRQYETVLAAIETDWDQPVRSLPLMSEEERHRVLVDWNATECAYPTEATIHSLFEKAVAEHADSVAIVCGHETLSYDELNRKSNQVAHYLRELGVGPEVLVGVCMGRSLDMVACLLGILKSGGAYVPLDPEYPSERVEFMLHDAKVAVLMTEERLADGFPVTQAQVVCVDRDRSAMESMPTDNPSPEATADNLAYVIYTSGSTGTPKGVAIEHRSTVSFLHWAANAFRRDEFAGVLASTSICFDLSVFEFFAPLTSGGKVIVADDVLQLASLPAAREVTLINTVPSAITGLLKLNAIPESVRAISFAGEPLRSELVRNLERRGFIERIYDLYGPSEDTTYSTFATRTGDGPETIGKPIANTQAYVLDGELEPVPIGVPGELYLSGAGLARGYLYRPELTAQKFVENPFVPGTRMYKTGDRARLLHDGNLEFLGRIDHQVKLRGYRIELGEIESVLCQHPGVRSAVVVVRGDVPDERRLVAYLISGDQPVTTVNELRRHLGQKLPTYMIPSVFVTLDAFPMTPNGKVDRKALPEPEGGRPDLEDRYEPPRSPTEEALARQWRDLLNVREVGIRDDFFDLGGHSLLAIQLLTRVRSQFHVDLSLRSLFQQPTVADLAEEIEALQERSTHAESTLAVEEDRI